MATNRRGLVPVYPVVGYCRGGRGGTGVQSAVISTLEIPADPYTRIANVSAFLQVDVSDLSTATIGMSVDGVDVAQAECKAEYPAGGSGLPIKYNVTLVADGVVLPTNRIAQVTTAVVISPVPGLGTYRTFAGPVKNRIGATVFPRAF